MAVPVVVNRRTSTATAALLLCPPVVAIAQRANKTLRVGIRAGDLIASGADQALLEGLRAQGYVDGRNLVVERPTVFEFAVNQKVAKSLGHTIPFAVLAQADEVIE